MTKEGDVTNLLIVKPSFVIYDVIIIFIGCKNIDNGIYVKHLNNFFKTIQKAFFKCRLMENSNSFKFQSHR